ncbi:MAG: zinc-binding alcohol dehydrogenase family protein [Lysobacterales bacterium]
MKAIGYETAGPITRPGALVAFEAAEPEMGPRDLRVAVHGVSVNPVDTKVRTRASAETGQKKILGFDASGVVESVGADVTLFAPGDAVFYAGDITRQGTNAQWHVVDERIVGAKPVSLSHAEAAALPLTAITAWEMLFDSFSLVQGQGDDESVVIIGGAGGVGSIMVQLARQLTGLTVVATASRPDTADWVKKMGAHHVINHHEPLPPQLAELNLTPRYVACLTATDQHFAAVVELIKPRGHIALIDDPQSLDVNSMKPKALSLSWEFMFTRSMFQTPDMIQQHQLLNQVSALIDAGTLVTTATNNLGPMTVESLINAHTLQESGRAIGKTVLEGF